jgi:hypothetical protein
LIPLISSLTLTTTHTTNQRTNQTNRQEQGLLGALSLAATRTKRAPKAKGLEYGEAEDPGEVEVREGGIKR